MDVGAYLERIRFVGSTEPSWATLRALHRAHVLSVPFESLSIHCGEPISLNLEKIYHKIVGERRGGFCCECNGIFSWLLRELGFHVTLCAGRVLSPYTHRYGPPYQHLIILVTLGAQDIPEKHSSPLPSADRQSRRFLVDVGFGSIIREPLEMESGRESQQESGLYRVREDCPAGWWSLEMAMMEEVDDDGMQLKTNVELQLPAVEENGQWTVIYKFQTTACELLEFSDMCWYNQTSPHAMCAAKSLCTIHTPQGRVSYVGRRLISTTITATQDYQVHRKSKAVRELSDEEIPIVLKDFFGIVLKNPLVPKDNVIEPEECVQF